MNSCSRVLLAAVVAVAACVDDSSDPVVPPASIEPTGCELGGDGPTACPRLEPLIDHGPGQWTVLDVRSATLEQSHCAEMTIWFGGEADDCDPGPPIAEVYFIARGGGAYAAVTEALTCLRDANGDPIGPPAGQPRFAANVHRIVDGEPIAGTGVIEVEQTFLDNSLTRGAIDVVFADGKRLLADFAAPLCATE